MPAPLYLCVHVRDFAAQALTQSHELGSRAIAILNGDPPLERVFAMNGAARQHGLEAGMSRVQAESFPILLLRRDRVREDAAGASAVVNAMPTAKYNYGESSVDGKGIENPADRLTSESTILNGTTLTKSIYSYDTVGHVGSHYQCVTGNCGNWGSATSATANADRTSAAKDEGSQSRYR